MNIFIFLILFLSILGLLDKILNNKLGLVKSFNKGIDSMGSLALSMVGFYCVAVTFVSHHIETISQLSSSLHLDPSVIVSCLLAPDMGGYAIAHSLTQDSHMLILTGVVITSTIGTVFCFQLPVFLTTLKSEDLTPFIQGLVFGIVTLPLILLPLAIYLKIENIFFVLLPVFVICGLLVVGLLVLYKQTIAFLGRFGEGVRILSLVLFGMVVVQLYFSNVQFSSYDLIEEAMVVVLKCSIIASGSMILCDLIIKFFSRYINWLGEKLGLNNYSVIGLFLGFASSIAMLPLFNQMDYKGKVMNAACSVSGAYVLGSQLGFIASVSSSQGVMLFMISKIVAGILAMGVAYIYENKKQKNNAVS